jgi:hypothetical protein
MIALTSTEAIVVMVSLLITGYAVGLATGWWLMRQAWR